MCFARSRWQSAVTFCSLLAASSTAFALQADGDVGIDSRYSDNAVFTPSNTKDDLITTASIGGSVSEDQGSLTGRASASLRNLYYLDNTFDDQTYLDINANADWEQVSNVLRWSVSDYYNQYSIDNLAADTPSNTENINAFNLAATLKLRPADRHMVSITPSVSDYYYDTSSSDNQQKGIGAGWSYQFRPTISVSLGGSYRDVSYDEDTQNDHTNTSVSVAAAVTRVRSEYRASIGKTKVNGNAGNDTDGLNANLDVMYRLSNRSTMNARVSTDITDTSAIYLGSSVDPNTGNFGNIQISNDVLRNSVFRVSYDRPGTTVNFSGWFELRDLDYKITNNDRRLQEYGARLGYQLTPRMSASVGGSYIWTRLENPVQTDKYYNLDGNMGYVLSRKLTARAGVRYQSRDSADPLQGFDEYSISAGLGYRLGR